jgi:hypothetical protein
LGFGCPEYRMFSVDVDGHRAGIAEMACREDGEAVAKAKRLIDDHDLEVWNRDRFVTKLIHKSK